MKRRFRVAFLACVAVLAGSSVVSGSGVASASASGASWRLGGAYARLIAAGWRFDPRAQAWFPEADLRIVDPSSRRAFHRGVRVEFIPAAGRPWVWRTFVALGPEMAQHRNVSPPGYPGFRGGLEDCPALGLRVDLRRGSPGDPVQPLPRLELPDPEAPPAGVPLYVASVEDGAVLRLVDGRRVVPLGLAFRGPGDARLAREWAWERVRDRPVVLRYDGIPPDRKGRFRAYVRLAGGSDLGSGLVRMGWAVPETGTAYSKLGLYKALAARSASGASWRRSR